MPPKGYRQETMMVRDQRGEFVSHVWGRHAWTWTTHVARRNICVEHINNAPRSYIVRVRCSIFVVFLGLVLLVRVISDVPDYPILARRGEG